MSNLRWDREADVVVVGSGAAGLTAAVVAADAGCEVEIVEKAALVGGTSAFSGGMVWIPLNHHQKDGARDDRDEVLEYIRGLMLGREPDPRLIETYVDRAAEAVEYIESHTGVSLQIAESWSDYFADRAGGSKRGRSLDNSPIPVRKILGDWYERMRRGPHMPATLTEDEVATFGVSPDPGGRSQTVGDDVIDLASISAEREAAGLATMGQALVGGLLRGVLDRDAISVSLETPMRRLVVEDGAVVGIVVEARGSEVAIRARRGVVLACGGFEWNEEMVRAYLGVPEIRPLSPPSNEGDGHLAAMEVGARMANMNMGWGIPVTYDGKSTFEGKPLAVINLPRMEPGAIMINKQGRRFVNEGISYMDFQKVFRAFDPATHTYPNESSWVVFDDSVRQRVYSGDFVPGAPTPEWVKEAPTIAALAESIGVDAHTLTSEVRRWNKHVEAGADPDFGRGTIWMEGWTTGGPDAEKALAPIGDGPYYAMPVYDGYLGTNGGILVDESARVRAMRGGVIEGLYAAGNVAASIFGAAYPGGGCTLGQGVTFGYLAALHLSGRETALSRSDEPPAFAN